MTPSPTTMDAIKVTTNCNERDWCHHREASKTFAKQAPWTRRGRPWQSASKPQAALPTSATRTSWGPCEHHNNTHLAMTTTIVIAGSIAATPVCRNKQEALCWQEASSRSGKCMPLISYNASVGINENKNANNNDKNYAKKRAVNVRHHGDHRHSSDDKLRDDPCKSRCQQRQRERKQEQQLLVRQ